MGLIHTGPKKGVFKHTEEAKKKIALASTGRVFSKETCAKISAANIGKRHTEEAKAKNAEKHRGIIQSQETINKRANSNRGKKRSPKTKALMVQKAIEREAKKKSQKL